MKVFKLIITIIGIFTSFASISQEDDTQKNGVITEADENLDSLQKFTQEHPEVKKRLEICKAMDPDELRSQFKNNIMNCAWEPLGDDIKTEIWEELESQGIADRDDDNAAKYSPNMSNFKLDKSEAVKKLEEYLKKKLEEELYDENSDSDVKGVTNHSKFINLYKSQIGKNLITEMASYCIYSDPKTGIVPWKNTSNNKKKRQFYRETNIKNLSQYGNSDQSFTSCIQYISPACQEDTHLPSNVPQQDRADPYVSYDDNFDASQSNTSSTIIHPCTLNRYMTGAKIALQKTEELIEEVNKNKENSYIQFNRQSNPEFNTDNVVNVGSGEIVKESGYDEELRARAERLQECAEQGGNQDGCDEFLSDEEEADKINEEFEFRNLALQDKMKKELFEDESDDGVEKLKSYLKEKGMAEESLEKLLAKTPDDQTPFEYLKTLIETRYNREKEALQESLKKRLEKTTITQEQRDSNPDAAKNKFEALSNEAKSSPESIAQVYQYANVVSSFIKVEGADGESGTNTAALTAELNNNFFGGDTGRLPSDNGAEGPAAVTSGDLSDLQEFAGSNDSQDGGDIQGGATLNANQVDIIQFGLSGEEDE